MTTEVLPVVGLDVAQAKVDVALLMRGKCKSKVIENSPAGFTSLTTWLTKQGVSQAVFAMEATGSYHEALALYLSDHRERVYVINPARIKGYAQASMLRGKTDSADARVIAEFAANKHTSLNPWVPPSIEVRGLRDLTRRLEALKDLRQQEANRLAAGAGEPVLASLHAVVLALDDQIAKIQRAIDDHIEGHPSLKAQRGLLASIPGLGPRTIPILIAEVPWHTFTSAAQAGAYTGLSPRRHESGKTVMGKSRISKIGSPRLRHALYFPAIVATKHNPILHTFYQRLLANGKTKMSAIAATMRKLVHIAFGVLHSAQAFDPLYLEKSRHMA